MIMNGKLWKAFAGLGAVAMSAVWAGQAGAQTSEVKEKPPLYTYVANWNIPRAQWADMEKAGAANQKILDKAVGDGTIVGYGTDVSLVHQGDGVTHDDWWSAMSLAGVLHVLDQFTKSGDSTASVLDSATNHFDNVYVSRFYNWHPGSWKDGYTYAASYRLKPDAPEDSVDDTQQAADRAAAGETARRRHAARVRSRYPGGPYRSSWHVYHCLPRGEGGRAG